MEQEWKNEIMDSSIKVNIGKDWEMERASCKCLKNMNIKGNLKKDKFMVKGN